MVLTKTTLLDDQIKTATNMLAQLNRSGKHGTKLYLHWQNLLKELQTKQQ
jgi:hypothetical protein